MSVHVIVQPMCRPGTTGEAAKRGVPEGPRSDLRAASADHDPLPKLHASGGMDLGAFVVERIERSATPFTVRVV